MAPIVWTHENYEYEIDCPRCTALGVAYFDPSCRKCEGSGKETLVGPPAMFRVIEDQDSENARLTRELNVAHERIVALTKALQNARPGGDVSRAVPTGDSPALTEASPPTPSPAVNIPAGTQGDAYVGFGI